MRSGEMRPWGRRPLPPVGGGAGSGGRHVGARYPDTPPAPGHPAAQNTATEPLEVILAAFWGEGDDPGSAEGAGAGVGGADAAPAPGGGPSVPVGEAASPVPPGRVTASAVRRLREPEWWDGAVPLLLLLRDIYTTVTNRASDALRAVSPEPGWARPTAGAPPAGEPTTPATAADAGNLASGAAETPAEPALSIPATAWPDGSAAAVPTTGIGAVGDPAVVVATTTAADGAAASGRDGVAAPPRREGPALDAPATAAAAASAPGPVAALPPAEGPVAEAPAATGVEGSAAVPAAGAVAEAAVAEAAVAAPGAVAGAPGPTAAPPAGGAAAPAPAVAAAAGVGTGGPDPALRPRPLVLPGLEDVVQEGRRRRR